MHLSCYKIKLYYYYLLSPLRCTSTVFYFVRHQQKLQKLHGCNRYPPSSPKRLTFPRIPFIPRIFPRSPFPSRIVFFLPSIHLARSLAWSFRAVCQARRRHTPGIVLILSYVAAAIVSSLRSSAIPLTAAYVSNACRGMSGDSPRKVE